MVEKEQKKQLEGNLSESTLVLGKDDAKDIDLNLILHENNDIWIVYSTGTLPAKLHLKDGTTIVGKDNIMKYLRQFDKK
jgi:hypothetical protein